MTPGTANRTETAPDTLGFLEQLPAFYDFSHSDLKRVANHAQYLVFEPRETIYQLGHQDSHIYFVVSGLVRLTTDNAREIQPDDLIVRSRGIFGEDCALDESPRGMAAQALMRTECVALTIQGLRRLEEENTRLALRLIKKLARTTSLRLRQVVGRGLPTAPELVSTSTTTPGGLGSPKRALREILARIATLGNQAGPKTVQSA